MSSPSDNGHADLAPWDMSPEQHDLALQRYLLSESSNTSDVLSNDKPFHNDVSTEALIHRNRHADGTRHADGSTETLKHRITQSSDSVKLCKLYRTYVCDGNTLSNLDHLVIQVIGMKEDADSTFENSVYELVCRIKSMVWIDKEIALALFKTWFFSMDYQSISFDKAVSIYKKKWRAAEGRICFKAMAEIAKNSTRRSGFKYLCCVLQSIHKGQPFFLTYRKAARWLGIENFQSLESDVADLCFDELLIRVKKGSRITKRATRWRWKGGIVIPMLKVK